MSEPIQKSAGWVVGVNIPEQTDDLLPRQLLLKNMAVATSGDAYQYISHAGKKYSHIIDPKTGYGMQAQRNVTVIAKDGTTADWLATACSILPIPHAKQLATKMEAALLITEIRDNKILYYKTGSFDKYWKPL
jgi:thiamine biosynthesis lipoprotein